MTHPDRLAERLRRQSLVANAEALITLDERGVLRPHGIGGPARTIIKALLRELEALATPVPGAVSNAMPLGREKLGEMIYRALYEHQGGRWAANETREVWYEAADRLLSSLAPVEPVATEPVADKDEITALAALGREAWQWLVSRDLVDPHDDEWEGFTAAIERHETELTAPTGDSGALREALEPFAKAIKPDATCISGWRYGVIPATDDYIRAYTVFSKGEPGK